MSTRNPLFFLEINGYAGQAKCQKGKQNYERLFMCHQELKGNKAAGVDMVTKAKYDENVFENVINLHQSLCKMAYKPRPLRRMYFPKTGYSKDEATGGNRLLR